MVGEVLLPVGTDQLTALRMLSKAFDTPSFYHGRTFWVPALRSSMNFSVTCHSCAEQIERAPADLSYLLLASPQAPSNLAYIPFPFHVQDNGNAKSYLQAIKNTIMENLRAIVHAPSVQMHEVPPDSYIPEVDQDDLTSPDERFSRTLRSPVSSPFPHRVSQSASYVPCRKTVHLSFDHSFLHVERKGASLVLFVY